MNEPPTKDPAPGPQQSKLSAADSVVVDPMLTKDQKAEALDVLEQDARQLLVASDEGMTGGEMNNLRAVLIAKDKLDLPASEQAYHFVTQDLRGRLAGVVTGDAHALLTLALAALLAATRSMGMKEPEIVPHSGNTVPGDVRGNAAIIARS